MHQVILGWAVKAWDQGQGVESGPWVLLGTAMPSRAPLFKKDVCKPDHVQVSLTKTTKDREPDEPDKERLMALGGGEQTGDWHGEPKASDMEEESTWFSAAPAQDPNQLVG